jgi:hypothetical protein
MTRKWKEEQREDVTAAGHDEALLLSLKATRAEGGQPESAALRALQTFAEGMATTFPPKWRIWRTCRAWARTGEPKFGPPS